MPPLGLIVLLWCVYFWGQWGNEGFYWLGIYPRSLRGLAGLCLSPLIHTSVRHAFSNSVPLLILGSALGYFYPRAAGRVWAYGWLGSGAGVWLIGRPVYHVGASGVVYVLAAFIFVSGILGQRRGLAALSLLVVFLYGSLVWGVLPIAPEVSWEAHLCGAVAGVALAIVLRPAKQKTPTGYGNAAAYDYSTQTHTGAPNWRIVYRSPGSPQSKRVEPLANHC